MQTNSIEIILIIFALILVSGALYLDYKNIFSLNKKEKYMNSIGFIKSNKYWERTTDLKQEIIGVNIIKRMSYEDIVDTYK